MTSQLLWEAVSRFKAAGIDSSWFDAELLLAYVLQKDQSWLLAHPDYRVNALERKQFLLLVRRRSKRISLAYLTSEKEFYGVRFRVTPAVLIPRPETEQLIERALPYLQKLPRGSLVADIGTGSGCIAITLARLLPHLRFVATDTSKSALTLARLNANHHCVSERIRFVQDQAFSVLNTSTVTAIIANLPYLSARELTKTQRELLHEPRRALVSGTHGDECVKRLITAIAASSKRAKITIIALEVNPRHVRLLLAYARKKVPQISWKVDRDLSHLSRFLFGLVENHFTLFRSSGIM